MIATSMLARVRELIDEVSSSFWTDSNLYIALSEAQRQLVNLSLATYKMKLLMNPSEPLPEVLRPLYEEVANLAFGTTGVSSVALPADFLFDLHVEYDDNSSAPIPAYKIGITPNRKFSLSNTYLGSNQSQFYYWIDDENLNFGTVVSGTGSYRLTYLKKPTEIDATPTNPVLPTFTHEALCQYAVAEALKKDKEYQAAQIFYNTFLQLAQNFI